MSWASQGAFGSGPVVTPGGAGGGGGEAALSLADFVGLEYAKTGNLVVTVQPGKARNIADTANIVLPASATCDLTVTGAGGKDYAGAIATDTWHSLWVMGELADPSNVDVIASQSATAAGINYPGTFDVARRIGSLITNGEASIIRSFVQIEDAHVAQRVTTWDPQESTTTTVLLNGGNTAYTPVDLSDWIPPWCTLPILEALASDDSLESLWYLRPTGNTNISSVYKGWCGVSSTESGSASQQMRMRCSTSQSIDYRVVNASCDLDLVVVGYHDEYRQ